MQVEWIRKIRDKCLQNDVPFFFKQWGGVHKKRFGRILEGRTWNEMPEPKRRYSNKAKLVFPSYNSPYYISTLQSY